MKKLQRIVAAIHLILAFSGLLSLSTGPVGAQHPNHPLGLDPSRQVQGIASGIDNVDLFSGTLTQSIPIGPFSLIYNSNVWRYQTEIQDNQAYIHARPDGEATAGMGWHLGWGEVYSPTHTYNTNDDGDWLYVDENGAHHVFHDRKLHEGDADDPDPDRNEWMYSRDGSYMRFHRRCVNGCQIYMVTIEFPDGTTRLFDSGTGGWNTTYHLHKVWGPHASESDPDLTIEYDRSNPGSYSQILDREFRTVTDRAGRQIHVTLGDTFPGFRRLVTQVAIDGFNGQTATYDFEYQTASVHRSCKDDWPGSSSSLNVAFLTRVVLSDGSFYSMADGGTPRYHLGPCDGIDDQPGVATGITLPTGGGVEWTYQEYEFPPGDTSSVFNTSVGVKTRQLLDADGSPEGNIWHYRTTSFGVDGDNHPEIQTEVVYPDGTCSKHYFDAIYYVFPSQGEGWERGLPFTYRFNDGAGKFLSSEAYDANDAGTRCAGTKLRSHYVKYRVDQFPGGNDLGEWLRLNQAVEASSTVYHDDGNRWSAAIHSDFNGVGSFRRTVTQGTIWDGSSQQELRQTDVDVDAERGTYPGSYSPVLIADRWLFGRHSYRQVHEPDAEGGEYARTELDFAEDGFLNCTRTLSSSTVSGGHVVRSSNDVVTVFERSAPSDPYGTVGAVKSFGGDLQPIATTGPECGMSTAGLTPEYWTGHEYENGIATRSYPVDPANPGAPPLFYTLDVDLDPDSGLVAVSRDSSGYQTAIEYDEMGRLTRAIPEDGAEIHNEYTPFDGSSSPATGATTAVLARSSSGQLLTRSEVELDPWGRPTLERRLMADGTDAEKASKFDELDRLEWIGEWDSSAKTYFLEYDAFGRAQRIRPPDGATHDILVDFAGVRAVTRSMKRTLALSGTETYTSRTREYDAYGRLRTVREPSGASGQETPTSLSYDVGHRMTRTETPGDPPIVQVRTYDYDQRGFLLAESHPEVTGAVTYGGYDPAGRFHHHSFAQNSLSYEYDFVGRVLEIREPNKGHRLLAANSWDGADPGKLEWTEHHNYIDHVPENVPWLNGQLGDVVQVRQLFEYAGIGGRESTRFTRILAPSTEVNFRLDLTYDDLGRVDEIHYPRCVVPSIDNCTSSEVGSGRRVGHGYSHGWLTSVFDAASPATQWAGITYHPSGLWSTLLHANGVRDVLTLDPSVPTRPQRIHTENAVPAADNFDSGLMAYDGAGNLKALGNSFYAYDEVGRIAASDMASPLGVNVREDYTYDVFGNATIYDFTFPGPAPIDSSTNRLIENVWTDYDDAGNLLAHQDPLHPPWVWRYNAFNKVTVQNSNQYAYDGFGERIASFNEGGWNFHLRDPEARRLSSFVLDDDDWSRDDDFIYGGGRVVASSTHDFHHDHLGNVRLVTDASGQSAETFTFTPYGVDVEGDPSAESNPYTNVLFTGHERDWSTGADYMHARHYHKKLGRFTSVDPLRGSPGEPQSLNRYAYVLGNPLNFTDPRGTEVERPALEDGPAGTFGDEIVVTARRWWQRIGPPSVSRILWGLEFIARATAPSVPRSGRTWGRGLVDLSGSDRPDPDAEPTGPFDPYRDEEGNEIEEDTNWIGTDCDAVFKPTVGASFTLGIGVGASVDFVFQPFTRFEISIQYPVAVGADAVVYGGLGYGQQQGHGLGGTALLASPGVALGGIGSATHSFNGSSSAFAGAAVGGSLIGPAASGGADYTIVPYNACK